MTTLVTRQRVSVLSDCRMVTLQGAVVPVEGEPARLRGWVSPPLGAVLCVALDDGRELLVASQDVTVEP